MPIADLKSERSHFRFGHNWQRFLATVTAESLAEAERAMARLFPGGELTGSRVLDVGSGSGLSILAALRLGASWVDGIDIDKQSAEASCALLDQHAVGGPWSVQTKSVFDLDPKRDGPYDVVHSWGALHHTGDMWQAIARAAAVVVPGGIFAVALYRRTPFCRAWTAEKRFYSSAPESFQRAIAALFKAAFVTGLFITGRSPARYIAEYKSRRGMSWEHDVHDWLGGYPYESAEPAAVIAFLDGLGFEMWRMFEHPATAGGLFGSHCDEFVARKRPVR